MTLDEITYDRTVRIAAPREVVYTYFTDAEKLTRWMGSSAQLESRAGGIYRVDMNGRDVARGEFIELEPPERVVFSFGWESGGAPIPPSGSTVEVTLFPEGDGTIVRLVHRGLPQSLLAPHAEGWDHHLDRLVVVAAGGDPGPDPLTNATDRAPSA